MVANTLRRRAAVAALALFCAGFLSTCDFLTSDIFPSWFSYVDARVDLKSAIVDFVTPSNQLNGIDVEYIRTLSGRDLVVILFMGSANRRLLLLDPGDMHLLASLEDSVDFTPFIAAGSDGNLAVGRRSIDPSSYTSIAGASTGVNGSRQWLLRTGPASDQFLIGFDGDPNWLVQRYKYSSAWIFSGSQTGTDWSPLPANYWSLLDAETSITGSGATFLFEYYGGANTVGYVSFFTSTASIDTGTLSFFTSSDDVTGPFRLDEHRAWITSGGPVAYVRGDRSTDRLVRYKFGTGDPTAVPIEYAVELDSIPVDDNDDLTVLSFDASGTWWFVFDRRTGYLYKLRTWWK